MIFSETDLAGAFIIEIKKKNDERGFFARTFCDREFQKFGIHFQPVQINVSYSKFRHTLRGLHYQDAPFCEAKLIRCTHGSIFDVIIDLRKDSPTYKQWLAVELSKKNNRMFYVPEGFAHGFLTLEDETEITYPVSEFYTPDAEKGIRWNDPEFNIDWPEEIKVVSQKDQNWADFQE